MFRSDGLRAMISRTCPTGCSTTRRNGLVLVDGGLANNASISQAVALGLDRIFALLTEVACALTAPPASPFASAVAGAEQSADGARARRSSTRL